MCYENRTSSKAIDSGFGGVLSYWEERETDQFGLPPSSSSFQLCRSGYLDFQTACLTS